METKIGKELDILALTYHCGLEVCNFFTFCPTPELPPATAVPILPDICPARAESVFKAKFIHFLDSPVSDSLLM